MAEGIGGHSRALGRFTLASTKCAKASKRRAEVTYHPDAGCPNFLTFLDRIAPGRDMQVFLQSWFGYCLAGDMLEQKILITAAAQTAVDPLRRVDAHHGGLAALS